MKLFTHLILSMPIVGAFAIFAVGIVVIYRASRVLNLAHGAMAMIPAYVGFSASEAGIPLIPAVLLGVLSGAVLGLLVERIFVRGLRHMSLTAQTVGTVAVLSLLIAVASRIWGTAPQSAPQVFPDGHISVGSAILLYGSIGLFAVAVILAITMLLVFRYTNLGLAMRAAADNRRAASLVGVDPDRTTAVAWAIGGGLAGIAGILLAAITTLDPFTLPLQTLPAFVAVLLGGIESVGGSLGGAALVGVILGLVPATATWPVVGVITRETGGPQLVLTLIALFVMYRRGERFSVAQRDQGTMVASGDHRTGPRRRLPPALVLGLTAVLISWVWLPGIPFSVLANVNLAMVYALVGLSLVLLTGWVGQISLGHAALVGIGAFGTGLLTRELGISFPFNLPLTGLLAGGVALLLGAVALRVRGLYLAVATLIFSWMADAFLFSSSWFVGVGGSSTIDKITFGSPGGFPNFDFSDRKILYYFGLAIFVLAVLALANLRASKTGRAFFATRDSETAAASLGIDVMRYKLLAFALSGFVAGVAGNLIMIDQRTVVPAQFAFTVSLFYLSIAVVGGLRSIPGVVAASALFAGLNELFFRVQALGGLLDLVSAGLLVAALLIQAKAASIRTSTTAVIEMAGRVLRPLGRALGPLGKPLGRALEPVRAAGRVAGRGGDRLAAAGARAREAMARRVRPALEKLPVRRARGEAPTEAVEAPLVLDGPDAAPEDGMLEPAAAGALAGNGSSLPALRRPDEPSASRAVATALARVGAALQPYGRRVAEIRRAVSPARGLAVVRRRVRSALPGSAGPVEQIDLDQGRGELVAHRRDYDEEIQRALPGYARSGSPVVLEGRDVTVRFGGLVAVGNATVQVREREIVGLIGPNGAGKTTLFNALCGLNQPTGDIELFGREISSYPVHERARLGLSRTFQVLQLFAGLSVRENLLVATHTHNRTGFMSHILATDAAVEAERSAQQRVGEVIDSLEMHDIADRPVGGLPFGILRLVELGRAVVTGAPIILLDEPASGLDNTETERFTSFLRDLRDRFGITMLLIEHDVKMVTGVSDYMYVLAMGQIISQGPPEFIKRDPAVIAAYLGQSADEQDAAKPEPVAVGG